MLGMIGVLLYCCIVHLHARMYSYVCFFFQADGGIRAPLWSRGLGAVSQRPVPFSDLLNDPPEFPDLADPPDPSSRFAAFEPPLFSWLRNRKQRTVVDLDEIYKRSPEADERAGIIIGRW